jgi:leucine dehydrogenase
MEYVLMETEHVGGLIDRSGDPSPMTARGVFRAIQASAKHRWGSDDLSGRTVALQGCGHVGYHLARELKGAGASLVVADVGAERAARAAREFGARTVEPREIYDVEADVFAPCALGGVINDETLPRLRVGVVAGAANNQLLEVRHGDELAARGILYAPDYVANAGGVINGCRELLGWEPARSRQKIEEIYDTLLDIFRRAERDGVSTARSADRLAEGRLAGHTGRE